MPDPMTQAQLVTDLKGSLTSAIEAFPGGDGDLQRHLAIAALALGEKRPRTLLGSVALVAGQPDYPAPALLLAFKSHLWGIAPVKAPSPWEPGYPGRLPDVRLVETGQAPVTRKLYLDPPPTAWQISVLGAEFKFYYRAGHAVDADATKTTVAAGDRGLLLLRAQAEAMRELAMRNVASPQIVREGLSSVPRNGTPSWLYADLMKEFREAA